MIDKAAGIAAKKVRDIVGKSEGDQAALLLNSWIEFLMKKARIIWVEVPDESSAYLIFETMNDRGLELSASDLIKNYLLGKAGDDNKLQTIKLNWTSMVSVLNTAPRNTEVKDFVRHYWVSRNGVTRSQDLFDAIRKNNKNDSEAVDTSERLAQSAAMYVAILSAGHSTWNSYPEPVRIRKAVATLNVLGVEQVRPVLLAAMEHLSPKEMAKLLVMAISGCRHSRNPDRKIHGCSLGKPTRSERRALTGWFEGTCLVSASMTSSTGFGAVSEAA